MSMMMCACTTEKEQSEPLTEPVDTGTDTEHLVMVSPYLQSVGMHNAWVMWITETGEQSVVEWGRTEQLGERSAGETDTDGGIGFVHSVQLQGLEPGTQYLSHPNQKLQRSINPRLPGRWDELPHRRHERHARDTSATNMPRSSMMA